MFFTHNSDVYTVKGDKRSVGYKRSDLEFTYTNQRIKIEKNMAFYMATDCYIDQFGGSRNRRFGSKRFKNLLQESSQKSFGEQKEMLLQVFHDYQGHNERQDDVTVVGFGCNHLF